MEFRTLICPRRATSGQPMEHGHSLIMKVIWKKRGRISKEVESGIGLTERLAREERVLERSIE